MLVLEKVEWSGTASSRMAKTGKQNIPARPSYLQSLRQGSAVVDRARPGGHMRRGAQAALRAKLACRQHDARPQPVHDILDSVVLATAAWLTTETSDAGAGAGACACACACACAGAGASACAGLVAVRPGRMLSAPTISSIAKPNTSSVAIVVSDSVSRFPLWIASIRARRNSCSDPAPSRSSHSTRVPNFLSTQAMRASNWHSNRPTYSFPTNARTTVARHVWRSLSRSGTRGRRS